MRETEGKKEEIIVTVTFLVGVQALQSLWQHNNHGTMPEKVLNLYCVSLCLQTMLEYPLFHRALFALSVEIVICTYNSHKRFGDFLNKNHHHTLIPCQ